MHKPINDIDYLYHYTTAKNAIKYILPNKTLKLSSLKDVNDPVEYKNKTFFLFSGVSQKIDSTFRPIFKRGNLDVVSIFKIACFSGDFLYVNPEMGIKNIIGNELMNMWAYYGGNHTGVCLKINKDKFIKYNEFNNDWYIIDRMEYKDRRKSLNFLLEPGTGNDEIINYFKKNCKKLFFHKRSEWSNECEVRLVCCGKNENPLFLDISNSLDEITLGSKFDKSNNSQLKEIINDWNIKISQILLRRKYLVHQYQNCQLIYHIQKSSELL